MKAAFAIVLVALVGSGMSWQIPKEATAIAAKVRKTCAGKVSDALIEKLRAANTFPTEIEQEQYKCYLKCAYEEAGILKDNKLCKEELMKNGCEELKRVADICKDVQEPKPCDTAMAIQKCFYDNADRAKYFIL